MPRQRDVARPTGRTGRPPATSRAEILAAARLLIDRDGWESLTIRRLAAELDIGPTTLYHHVRDKDDLVVQLVNAHVDQVARPDLPDNPRDRIIVAWATIHDALADWPWGAEVLTADGFLGRLGDSALWFVETIVAGAIEYGCTPLQAVDLFRSIWYYTVGEILVRAHTDRRRSDVGAADFEFGLGKLDPSRYPQLAALGDQWPARSSLDIYPLVLPVFVDGLLTQATSKTH
ncbi:TetR/AcrR family transcriptional regulator [Actinomadura rudentiformis]|uniref:TetR/AcrR family transcriptional regulator n=1 Tax=Actinomadura rudentiformis TaxID=359158 RepID=A0A6H9YU23_9ACTN|nr:TetR/AcrR family transcriptional regulator [Actinomadura rudentiformis]KAB2349104.1 TetR/AcrR family transcriptional regulator [Actinomadura rudentiformis]